VRVGECNSTLDRRLSDEMTDLLQTVATLYDRPDRLQLSLPHKSLNESHQRLLVDAVLVSLLELLVNDFLKQTCHVTTHVTEN